MLTTAAVHDPAPLREALGGQVVAPGDPQWDEARRAWNLAVDQRPELVVVPESIADVQAAVRYAAERGLAVAVQGTGHQANAIASMAGSILVKTHRLRGGKIDARARTAIVRAGDLWEDVTGPASAHGLAPLAGSSPDVGVVGYTLGGGISWLGRRHGLSANSVNAIAVVLADGRLVRADSEHHSDLFWALRGGGGAMGVVVGMEIRLYDASELTAGALFYPYERTAEVGHVWRELVDRLADETTSILHVVQFPPLPEVPEPLRGRSLVTVEVAHLGTPDELAGLLAPLRALGPELDTIAATPPVALSMLHMDPPNPVPGHGTHRLLGTIGHEAIDTFAELTDHRSGSPLITAEIRHLGGALGRAAEGHGALGRVPGQFVVFGAGIAADAASSAAVNAHLDRLADAFAAYDSGHTYTNFVEEPLETAAAFDEYTWARLRRVKGEYDPANLFRVGRPID